MEYLSTNPFLTSNLRVAVMQKNITNDWCSMTNLKLKFPQPNFEKFTESTKFRGVISSIKDLQNCMIYVFTSISDKGTFYSELESPMTPLELVPEIGQIFAVEYETTDGKYKVRAMRIPFESRKQPADKINVQLIDDGDIEVYDVQTCLSKFYHLPENLKQYPANSILCKVHKVIPFEHDIPKFLENNLEVEFEFQYLKLERTSMLIHNMIMHINILNFNTSSSSADEADNSGNCSDAYVSLLPGTPSKVSKPKIEIDLNEIQKLSVEEIQQTSIEEVQETFIPKLKRSSVPAIPGKTSERLKPRLPDVGDRFLMTVVAIESLNRIYGQLINTEDFGKILNKIKPTLIDLNLQITKDFSKNELKKVTSLAIGDLVLAFFPGDRLYYRATVVKIDGVMCKVKCVDYGNSWETKVKHLRKCEKKHNILPFQAFKFKLANFDASSYSEQVKSEIRDFIYEHTYHKMIRADVVKKDGDKLELRLLEEDGFDIVKLIAAMFS